MIAVGTAEGTPILLKGKSHDENCIILDTPNQYINFTLAKIKRYFLLTQLNNRGSVVELPAISTELTHFNGKNVGTFNVNFSV